MGESRQNGERMLPLFVGRFVEGETEQAPVPFQPLGHQVFAEDVGLESGQPPSVVARVELPQNAKGVAGNLAVDVQAFDQSLGILLRRRSTPQRQQRHGLVERVSDILGRGLDPAEVPHSLRPVRLLVLQRLVQQLLGPGDPLPVQPGQRPHEDE